MRRVRLRSKRKFWPRLFLAMRPWRSITSRSGGRLSSVTGVTGHLGGQPDRRDQALRIGFALARNIERRSVIGRGADEREAQAHIDAATKIERLDRDQRLVVIHAEDRVVSCTRFVMK